jgi:hypothetical protein
MSDDQPTSTLITRAAHGDKQAWDALVERYAPLVWSICRRQPGAADTTATLTWSRHCRSEHMTQFWHPTGCGNRPGGPIDSRAPVAGHRHRLLE